MNELTKTQEIRLDEKFVDGLDKYEGYKCVLCGHDHTTGDENPDLLKQHLADELALEREKHYKEVKILCRMSSFGGKRFPRSANKTGEILGFTNEGFVKVRWDGNKSIYTYDKSLIKGLDWKKTLDQAIKTIK